MSDQANPTQVSVPWLPVRLLIVEDNTTVAMCVSTQLMRHGCEVHHASNGAEALHALQRSSYGLIFMDIGLPDMSGFELAEKVRALPDTKLSSIPIIALTGHQSENEHCLKVGMQDVLLKPAESETLVAIVEKHALPQSLANAGEDTSIIDWATCVAMCGGIEDDAREILGLCATDLNKTRTILDEAFRTSDSQSLCDELHRVSGGVCYLKLPELEKALDVFHQVVGKDSAKMDDMNETYDDLKQAIAHFQELCAAKGLL